MQNCGAVNSAHGPTELEGFDNAKAQNILSDRPFIKLVGLETDIARISWGLPWQ
jgi:hypothetical protein